MAVGGVGPLNPWGSFQLTPAFRHYEVLLSLPGELGWGQLDMQQEVKMASESRCPLTGTALPYRGDYVGIYLGFSGKTS